MAIFAAKPFLAIAFTRSSTTWMLTGLRGVHQRDDAVGLVGDEPRQRPVLVADNGFKQLRRAPDARQRVPDLMREHRGEARDGARRAAMRHLAVDLVGDGALLKQHDDMAGQFRHRRDVEVDQLLAADQRRGNLDAIFIVGRAPRAHLLDQRQKRAAEGHETVKPAACQHRGAGSEEAFRLGIGEDDTPVRRDHDDRMTDGVENERRGVDVERRAHAALRREAAENAVRSAAITSAGPVAVIAARRSSAGASGAWRSRYQPRCFRA
jgi:hypothetical protein